LFSTILVTSTLSACGTGFTSAGSADAGGDAANTQSDAVADAPRDAGPEAAPATCIGGFACVESAPQGWSGPGEIYAESTAPPPCTADFTSAYQGSAELSAPSASCSCSCEAPATLCAAPEIALSTSDTCGTTCDTVTLTPGACTTVEAEASCGSASPLAYISVANPALGAGSCSPQLSKQILPPSWALQVQACSPAVSLAQADCSSGSVCAPVPATPYAQGLCIWQAGDVSCPAGAYSVKHLFYGGVGDTRDCETCTCGAVAGASCAASLDVYTSMDASCSGGTVIYNSPISCAGSGFTEDVRITVTTTPGSCTASQGTPTGSAVPANPTTFCCPS
jgi:hypothetical protein